MASVKSFFLSRKTILTLISLMLAVVVTGYFIPQKFLTSPEDLDKWQAANPAVATVTKFLGLDHIYTSPLFAALLLLFLLSLSLSSYEQFRAAVRRTFGASGPPVTFSGEGNVADATAAVRALGYIPLGDNSLARRFVRNPWGYWGNFCLHAGIALSIAGSLAVVLFEKRGLTELIEGEVHEVGSPWTTEDRGLVAGHLVLPEPVRLDAVRREYYETDNLKQLYVDFSFLSAEGSETPYTMHINQTVFHRGIRAFQGKKYGHAFYVSFDDGKGGTHGQIFTVPHPSDRQTARFKRFNVDWSLYDFKAKYFTDAARASMMVTNPEFILKLQEGKTVIAEASLTKGRPVRIGPYTATLVEVRPWAGLIFMDTPGMGILFFGFFITVLGGFLHYFTPPREFSVAGSESGVSIGWSALRDPPLYRQEYETVVNSLSGSVHEK